MDLDLSDHRKAFDRYKETLGDVIQQTAGAVVKWRAASHPMVGLRAFFEQVDRTDPGGQHRWRVARRRWLSGDSAQGLDHGLDAAGTVRVVRMLPPVNPYSIAEDRLVDFYLLLTWSQRPIDVHWVRQDALVERLVVSPAAEEGPQLRILERFLLRGQGVQTVYTVGPGSLAETRYELEEDGRPAKAICRKIVEGIGDEPAQYYLDRLEEHYEVDGRGRLVRAIERRYDRKGNCAHEELLFARRQRANRASLSGKVKERLVEVVLDIARGTRLGTRARALLIAYCAEDLESTYPHFSILVVPEEVASSLERNGEAYKIWEPDELQGVVPCVEVSDLDLTEVGKALVSLIGEQRESGSDEWLAALLDPVRRAARHLNELDWSDIMPVAEGFLVVARDNTGEVDLDEDLRASAP